MEYIVVVSAFLRGLEDRLLAGLFLALGALAIVGAIWIVLFLMRAVRALFRPPPLNDWTIISGGDDEGNEITLLKAKAAQLGLYSDQIIYVSAPNSSLPRVEATLALRPRRSINFNDNTMQLSPSMSVNFAKAGYEDGDSISARILPAKATPFWNHPNRSKRYNNRIAVWITLWTTLITTLLAIGIEYYL